MMLTFDIAIAIVLLVAFIAGVRKGIIRQLFGLAALLLGVYGAFKFSHVAGHYLSEWFKISGPFVQGISFVVVFILILFLVIFVGRIAAKLISLATLGGVDKILGGVFSVLKIVCILCVLQFIAQFFNAQFHFLSASVETSFFYRFFDTVCRFVFPYLPL
ncbi:MAG: CvpA family protein [Prevotellaceae bacterium]|jgi:membrane protein required for colicin V production|nr:CvpA family protein [Prevotellaceae bacterium]